MVEVVDNEQIETLGTKQKFWFRSNGIPWLFKVGRPGTGENWSEKVTCELAKLLSLPCAHYEFARWKEYDGVATPKFVPDDIPLILGNQVLTRIANELRSSNPYKASEYTVATACGLVEGLAPRYTRLSREEVTTEMTPLQYFVGYLMFDCWIGNPDRHDENWGFTITSSTSVELAPTFDHASGLGVRETLETKRARLLTKDQGYSVESYVEKARTPFYGDAGKRLLTLDVVRELLDRYPDWVCFWVKQLNTVDAQSITTIFARLPEGKVDLADIDFAIKMLEANRRRMESLL